MIQSKQPMFRKEALSRLQAPEELDRLMQITTIRSWLLLGAFGCVLLMALLWGIFGKLSVTVQQNGVLLVGNEIRLVTSDSTGRVTQILISPGDTVKSGQVLALITADGSAPEKTTQVTSVVNGQVVSLRTRVGSLVRDGTPLFSIESFDGAASRALEGVMYITLDTVQNLGAGMRTHLAPATARVEEFGYVVGNVQMVSHVAATRDEMLAVLKNPTMVDDLIAHDAVYEVRITLIPGPDRGLMWTASHGPQFDLASGTSALVTIILKEERPISRLIPGAP